jgi:glutamate-1-semialdehyde aminotransferase
MLNNASAHKFACRYTPLGTQTLSKAPNRYVEGVYPKVIAKGNGCYLTDVDGKTYIDYIAALGPIILGYADSDLDSDIIECISKGVLFSFPSTLEGQTAALLSTLSPTTNMWKFTKTGSDACSMAVKIGRAYTGKNHVIVCGYHGWHDWYSIVNDKKAGIPREFAKYVTKVPYNDFPAFLAAIQPDTGVVMMEPQIFDMPENGYLEAIRKTCSKAGLILIFDETVTGFRYPGLLAQTYFKVYPDLTVIGKAAGNGYPFAAVGGKRDLMKTCERDDFFASTTFGGDCLGLTACMHVMDRLPEMMDGMMQTGAELKATFSTAFGGKAECVGFPTRTMFKFPTTEHKALFWQECCKRNVLFGYSNFIMAAHLDDNVQAITKEAIQKAARITLDNWNNPAAKLEGPAPVEVFRLLRS